MTDDAHTPRDADGPDPQMIEIALSDWDAVVTAFRDLFDGLGEIACNEHAIEFSSVPPDVATGIQIRRDGVLAASMPLHAVEGTIERIRWDRARTRIELLGDGIAYTYRIPEQLLRHRGASE